MATYLTAFNNIIFKFIDDLIETFPEENDFKVYKRTLTLLKTANAKTMCTLFKNYSYIYREKILSNDESFFLQTEYKEKARRVAKKLKSGCVYVNGNAADPGTPFGGFRQSGNGREGGIWGLEEYLEVKTVTDWK